MDLCRNTDLRGDPIIAHQSVGGDHEYHPHELHSSNRHAVNAVRCRHSRRRPLRDSSLQQLLRTLNLEISKLPLHRSAARIHSRSRLRRDPHFGAEMPISALVPSLSFLPTSTVYSASCSVGLLHPTAGPGVHQVRDAFTRKRARQPLVPYPPKRFP